MDEEIQKATISDAEISDAEREKYIFGLHRYLVWVGEEIPDTITLEGKQVALHDVIWKLINKPERTDEEKNCIEKFIKILETKEQYDEKALEKAHLTRTEAKQLYDESAGLIRAIMDLKELDKYKDKDKDKDKMPDYHIKKAILDNKVKDAHRWMGFLQSIEE